MRELTATEALLAERSNTHGSFEVNSRVGQNLKAVIRCENGYALLNLPQREALDFICSKIGRIVAGNPHHADHWDDIAGYAKLASQNVKETP